MCGIIGSFDARPKASVNQEIVDQYEEQHSRGTKGFGIAAWEPGRAVELLRSCEPVKFMFDLHKKDWPMMLVHHRQPTSSENWLDQTHPILVSHDSLEHDYLVVHNGIIRNDDELKAKHEALDFTYVTAHDEIYANGTRTEKWNDSECFAIEVSRYIENHITELDVDGSVAFIAVAVDKKTRVAKEVHFGRNTNPLKMAADGRRIFLSSEGKGDEIKADTLYSFKPEGKMKLHQKPLKFKAEEKSSWHGWTYPKPVAKTVDHEDSRDNHWWEDEKDKDPDMPGLLFAHPELDEYADRLQGETENFLDDLDDPMCLPYANVDTYLLNMRTIMEEAKQQMSEKYALPYEPTTASLPEPVGDPGCPA